MLLGFSGENSRGLTESCGVFGATARETVLLLDLRRREEGCTDWVLCEVHRWGWARSVLILPFAWSRCFLWCSRWTVPGLPRPGLMLSVLACLLHLPMEAPVPVIYLLQLTVCSMYPAIHQFQFIHSRTGIQWQERHNSYFLQCCCMMFGKDEFTAQSLS